MRLSEYVGKNVDSHDLIPLVAFVNGLTKATDATLVDTAKESLTIEYQGKRARLYGSTFGYVEKTQGVDRVGPKGVTLGSAVDRNALAISGYGLASALANQLAGSAPGDSKLGRGFAYRANLQALVEAGF